MHGSDSWRNRGLHQGCRTWCVHPAGREVTAAILEQLERVRTDLAGARAIGEANAEGESFQALPSVEPAYPVSWLAERLGLSDTEQRVLWTLIAHELCPIARQRVRDLNTEQVVDPSLDTIRRAVYGARSEPRGVARARRGRHAAIARRSSSAPIPAMCPSIARRCRLSRARARARARRGRARRRSDASRAFDDSDGAIEALELDEACRGALVAAFDARGLDDRAWWRAVPAGAR